MDQKYQCCFCGLVIEPIVPDVASLVYTTCADQTSARLQREQEMFCHTKCLRQRLHESAQLYVLDTLGVDADNDPSE
jgi:hypothetical protein